MKTKFGITLMLLAGVAVLAAFGTEYSQFNQPLAKDQEILHALNRLTFGPRPGDVDAVQKMGLKKWIDQQLHPERIAENPELINRLKPLASLTMSPSEIATNYPPPVVVQAMINGLLPMPADPEARARMELQAQRLRAKQEAKGDLAKGDLKDKQGKGGDPLQQAMRQQVLAVTDPVERRKLIANNTPQQVLAYDLNEAKLYRAIYSNRQLEEQMVDFWFNHFNVYMDKGADRILTSSYEHDAIRPHVFGKFRDLLEATAESPAMLFYLDNWQNVSPDRPQQRAFAKQKAKQSRGLNENYARELMELHTLGVDGGYTQQDIIEVARCFTGWTINQPNRGGEFMYNDRVHDKGEKIVLGVKIPAGGGQEDAERVLDILARHPSTARFISTKLAKKFVADDPPPALIDRMAKAFHDTDGDIRAVMASMLESKEFFSDGAFRSKVKTPLELVVSAVRATDADVNFAIPLATQMAQLGQPLYRKVEPTGYSSANAEWVNSAALLARMNFALALTENRVPGIRVDQNQFQDTIAATGRQILFREPAQQTLESIQRALEQKEPMPGLVAGLLLGSPDFQRR
jgi:uncharacterized protein (DUF1800 family)